jgi:hypothetical protein
LYDALNVTLAILGNDGVRDALSVRKPPAYEA